jgi:hypothetical protein
MRLPGSFPTAEVMSARVTQGPWCIRRNLRAGYPPTPGAYAWAKGWLAATSPNESRKAHSELSPRPHGSVQGSMTTRRALYTHRYTTFATGPSRAAQHRGDGVVVPGVASFDLHLATGSEVSGSRLRCPSGRRRAERPRWIVDSPSRSAMRRPDRASGDAEAANAPRCGYARLQRIVASIGLRSALGVTAAVRLDVERSQLSTKSRRSICRGLSSS